MWLFEVFYISVDYDGKRKDSFELDIQLFESELDIYIQAMVIVCGRRRENEFFVRLQLVAC